MFPGVSDAFQGHFRGITGGSTRDFSGVPVVSMGVPGSSNCFKEF